MKALVLSVVFALTSVVNAVSGNIVKDFAYNTEMNEGLVKTETVFKVENRKYLHNHLQYNYAYNAEGRVSAGTTAALKSSIASTSATPIMK